VIDYGVLPIFLELLTSVIWFYQGDFSLVIQGTGCVACLFGDGAFGSCSCYGAGVPGSNPQASPLYTISFHYVVQAMDSSLPVRCACFCSSVTKAIGALIPHVATQNSLRISCNVFAHSNVTSSSSGKNYAILV